MEGKMPTKEEVEQLEVKAREVRQYVRQLLSLPSRETSDAAGSSTNASCRKIHVNSSSAPAKDSRAVPEVLIEKISAKINPKPPQDFLGSQVVAKKGQKPNKKKGGSHDSGSGETTGVVTRLKNMLTQSTRNDNITSSNMKKTITGALVDRTNRKVKESSKATPEVGSKPKPKDSESSSAGTENTKKAKKRMKKEQDAAKEARLAAVRVAKQPQKHLKHEKVTSTKQGSSADAKRKAFEEQKAVREKAELKDRKSKYQQAQDWFSALLKGPAAFTCEQLAPVSIQNWLAQKREIAAGEGKGPSKNAPNSSKKLVSCILSAPPKDLARSWRQGKHEEKLPVYTGRKGTYRGFDEGYDFLPPPPPLPSKETKILVHSTLLARGGRGGK